MWTRPVGCLHTRERSSSAPAPQPADLGVLDNAVAVRAYLAEQPLDAGPQSVADRGRRRFVHPAPGSGWQIDPVAWSLSDGPPSRSICGEVLLRMPVTTLRVGSSNQELPYPCGSMGKFWSKTWSGS